MDYKIITNTIKVGILTQYVTRCKIINLIISQILLSFCSDIRAELYLKIDSFVYLPKRIDALLRSKAKGICTLILFKNL